MKKLVLVQCSKAKGCQQRRCGHQKPHRKYLVCGMECTRSDVCYSTLQKVRCLKVTKNLKKP